MTAIGDGVRRYSTMVDGASLSRRVPRS